MKCTVVGGCGFLGRHLVEGLLEKGHQVNVFDIRKTFSDKRVTFFTGDVCKKEDLLAPLKGVDVVFHCATPSPLSNDRQLFMRVNCDGTKILLDACKEMRVKSLVLTSSASVVYYGCDIEGGKESLPYAHKPMDHYTETKILQEQIVLLGNSEQLQTVALRPHGIFGPRDPHMLPTTARLAKAGKTKFIIGNGENRVDFTFVSNVVHAHILVAEKLDAGIAGKAYNITNDDPIFFWTFMSHLITGLGYPAPRYKLPYYLVYAIALLISFICYILRPIKELRATFTPMTVSLAGTHHWYSCERAKQAFGYKPLVPLTDAIKQTLDSFPELHRNLKQE